MPTMSAMLEVIFTAWHATSAIERLGAALGLVYVVLAIRQHRACWLASLSSTALYLYVFAAAHLYMQAGLQAFYVFVSVYGWWAWRREPKVAALAVSRASWRLQLAGLGAVLAAAVLSAEWLARESLSPAPYLDSLTTWASVFATWLVARKKLDNWPWWLVIDPLIVVLCWQQRLYPSMILYILYSGLAAIGWRSWYMDMKSAATTMSGARA
jgi:nicotinamide mononucleotide transporter